MTNYTIETGVYFLIRQKVVVYVGRTKNLDQRLLGHTNKQYDDVRFFPCPESKLSYYENRWIARFKPEYNAKAGRPKHQDPKNPVASYLRQSVINELRKIADEDKRSISTMIEIAVEEKYLNKAL